MHRFKPEIVVLAVIVFAALLAAPSVMAQGSNPVFERQEDSEELESDGGGEPPLKEQRAHCRKLSATRKALKPFTTFSSDSDCVIGGTNVFVALESQNVSVNGRDFARYKLLVSGTSDQMSLTELGDGVVLSQRPLGSALDLQVTHFGQAGYLVFLTADPEDFRNVESTKGPLEISIATKLRGEAIFHDDGSGPFHSWQKHTRITGELEVITDELVKGADETQYFQTLYQQDSPVAKYLRLAAAAATGGVPVFATENVLVKGPGTVAAIIAAQVAAPAGLVADILNSVAKTLRSLYKQLASTTRPAALKAIDQETAALTILKLTLCGTYRAAGSLNDAGAALCQDKLDDLEEAIGLDTDCQRVCAAPAQFSLDRCPTTYQNIQPIEELCDGLEIRELLSGDYGPGAAEVVQAMERNFTRNFAEIWRKLRTHCGCS
jgi:hypothetical protein